MPHIALSTANILQDALAQLQRYHQTFGALFPAHGEGQTYKLTPNQNWLASFWSGLLWLGYAATGDKALRTHAESLLPSYSARLDQRIRLNHDLGFLFTLAGRTQHDLTGDNQSMALALRGADELLARYNPSGRYIQAWHEVGDADESGRFIIDSMLNIPLLYWVAAITNDSQYSEVATAHAETSQRYLVREDGSTYHTYILNPETGEPQGPRTHQGYSDDSLWARGQGWAITGFAIAAQWTGRADFLQTAERAAARFMAEWPPDTIPLWDLRLPPEAPQYPDSSAAAIAASGLLRLAHLAADGPRYQTWAEQLIQMMIRDCFERDPEAHGLLRHGTLHAIKGWGVDTYQIFGDYFFLESLLMLHGRAPDFWGPIDNQERTTA